MLMPNDDDDLDDKAVIDADVDDDDGADDGIIKNLFFFL